MNHYEDDATTRVKDRKAIERLLALDARGLYDICRNERNFDVRAGAGGGDDYGAASAWREAMRNWCDMRLRRMFREIRVQWLGMPGMIFG